MAIHNQLQALALEAGWIVKKNKLLETNSEEAFLLHCTSSLDNLLLVLKYEYCERKTKFSFQNYDLSILVKYLEDNIYEKNTYEKNICEDSTYDEKLYNENTCEGEYLVSVLVKPCDAKIYLLDKAICKDSQNTAEKIKYFANRYSAPRNWKRYQIEFISKIWEKERDIRNVKSMMTYYGTDENYKPIDFIFVKIPAGWKILLNSFCEKDIFNFPIKQQCNEKDFYWERDISVYKLELCERFVYVEVQEYMNEDNTNSLLYIYVYYDLKDESVFFAKLEGIFCYSVEDVKKELEEMLWKYGYDNLTNE